MRSYCSKKNLKKSLTYSGLCLFAMLSSCKQEEKPNILFILADDLGFSQLGCYGSSYYQTPNIDKLAKEGLRFTNAYAACSVSSPTRASLMTGKYPARLHLTDFIPGNNRNDFLLTQPEWQKFLPLEEITVAEILRDAGYNTAIYGKWHLSVEYLPPASLPYNPDKQGFNETFVTHKPSKGLAQSWQDSEHDAHNVDTLTNLAIDFLQKNKSNPFLLFISHNTIHNPLKEKAVAIEKYKNRRDSEKPENNPVIGAMIERLDQSCGKIFEKIKELGLEEKTIIIFLSDNGGLQSDAMQTPLRAGKGWLYEGGIRVPMIIKWKNNIQPSKVSQSIISSIDFFPTLLEIAGIDTYPENVDGKSMVPILKNPETEIHEYLYWHYPHYHNGPPSAAIRYDNWKLIEWYENSLQSTGKPAFELYDLRNDIGETINLSDSLKNITMKLSSELKRWRAELNVQMPVANENR